ncbi:hypothetical protein NBRC3280_1856 [Acetobacter pasteurianus NBRC 3280]|uniref:Lipoprotein n=1 Tax=Acetobacter pasteurianus NBRC 3278 TaxID=1226660 RepID=A0A401X4M9_ACEPA|nr:hypothetical protein [Acetobacter pasteurianus]GCD59343.1 hypothetical protein NBRC3277_1918 [Acetobacter pasteurianus NBRC 3277]GCD62850.1 hypothetical protein NBRC3278_1943 [Acetobacter pasteurianus NBRC 3278]GCD69221.1 hypothetical protein NBRC3280_1856 [Acetobacter pasteurianus NBRC 3280]
MKKALLALGLLPLLAACADTAQGKLRQTVYDVDSAYHVLANPMPDVMAGKVPGVALTDTQKAIAKRASQSVFNEIQSLETSIEGGNSITDTAVNALQTDFASFKTCWAGLKTGTTPDACAAIGGRK